MVCLPLCEVVNSGAVEYPVFALGSSKAAVGFSGLFLSFVQNLPQLTCMQLLLLSCSFFVFCCPPETFAHMQVLPYCSKGSRVPVPRPVSITKLSLVYSPHIFQPRYFVSSNFLKAFS